ncbi:MAG: hypothetical protein KY445_17120, partial [Armatimonadetes bacterium]|nr:hypothetical protein [Armatimonadota bacterium]
QLINQDNLQLLPRLRVFTTKGAYLGRPTFITSQSACGWFALTALLIWSACGHFAWVTREVWNPRSAVRSRQSNEPFSARFVLLGLIFSLAGLLAWSHFAGLNQPVAVAFFGVYFVASLVLARLVVEGGTDEFDGFCRLQPRRARFGQTCVSAAGDGRRHEN